MISKQIQIIEVTQAVLKASLTTKNPDGVASLFPLSSLPSPPKNPEFILALDRIQDPGNLGNLFRTALAAEVEVVWLASGVEPLSPKVLRSSAGAILHLPFERFADPEIKTTYSILDRLNAFLLNDYQL